MAQCDYTNFICKCSHTTMQDAPAIAIVLLLLVTPVIINNLREFNKERKGSNGEECKISKASSKFYKPGTHNYLCRLDGAHS